MREIAKRKTFTAAFKSARKALKAGDEALSVIEAILARSPNVDERTLTKLRMAKRIGPAHSSDKLKILLAP